MVRGSRELEQSLRRFFQEVFVYIGHAPFDPLYHQPNIFSETGQLLGDIVFPENALTPKFGRVASSVFSASAGGDRFCDAAVRDVIGAWREYSGAPSRGLAPFKRAHDEAIQPSGSKLRGRVAERTYDRLLRFKTGQTASLDCILSPFGCLAIHIRDKLMAVNNSQYHFVGSESPFSPEIGAFQTASSKRSSALARFRCSERVDTYLEIANRDRAA